MLSTLAFTNQQDGGLIQVICNKNGARALMYCRQDNALFGVLYSPMYIDWGSMGVGGGGGGSTHRSFIQGGSSPRSNPLPFYIRSLTER